MKKIVWGAFVVYCAISLSGCALPEKPRISQLPQSTPPEQSSPVYIQEGETQGPDQPKYLDIEDQPQEKVVEERMGVDIELPSAMYINDRIFEYGRKLDRWKELDSQSVNMQMKDEEAAQMVSCFRRLQTVLNGYSDLRNKMLQSQMTDVAIKIGNEEIFELQKNDIAFLEDDCGRLLADSKDKSAGWNQREEGADLTQLETLIDRYAMNKEYEEIIQVWLKIPESQLGRIHLRTKILYGNALMYLHQEEKAAEIYQQVVNRMTDSDEQATDLVSLRKVLADLYTASGNYSLAINEYKNISQDYSKIGQLEEWSKLQLAILDRSKDAGPELNQFSEVLRNYLGFIPERDGYKIIWQAEKFLQSYPYSPVVSNVELIKDSVKAAADKWFNGLLAEIDTLGQEKQFSKALRLLETMPTDILSPDKQLVISSKKEELQLSEAVENETGKMVRMQDLQNQWNNGMLLAKGGRYEEAIVVFTNLLDTEYSTKAKAKVEELSIDAAKADRRKAADLFIRFTKTSDIESKKKLLVESRKLLKDILIKYPDVDIASKVAGNVERVEQEMNKIDPNLLIMADHEAAATPQDDRPGSAFTIPDTNIMTRDKAPIIETNLPLPLSQ